MTDHHAVAVHVGKPSPGFHQEWTRTYVYFHDFAGLSAERGHLVRTDNFVCLGGHQWRVGMYPGGENCDDAADGMTSIVLYNRSNVNVLFGFCVKDDTGREVGGTACHRLKSGKATISNFLKRSKIMKSLVDGTLVIEVRMRELAEPTKVNPTRFTRENIRHMFKDEETADILIRVQEEWESNAIELAETPQAAIKAYRLGGEDGVPRRGLRSRSNSRSKSRPHVRNRADRSKSRTRLANDDDDDDDDGKKRLGVQREERERQASDRREHPQQRHGESLREYWRRRAEESKERVSMAAMSSAGDADSLGSGAPSLTSRGMIDMPSLVEGRLFS
jgi:hypothetical protein